MNKTFFGNYFSELSYLVEQIDHEVLVTTSKMILEASQSGKKVILAGNGGSAAMASHVAVDLTKAAGVRAVNFNEADLITCFANDFGYEHWLEKAVEYFADSGDLLVLISSSGQSPNIINAAYRALNLNLKLVTLSGFSSKNPLKEIGDVNIWVPSESYNHVEMAHHIWLLSVVDYLIESG